MPLNVSELVGVTSDLADKLKSASLENSDKLLQAADTAAKRKQLAEQLGVETRAILELANRADLARVNGIGKVYSDLLEYAGVDTIAELSHRNPQNLYDKILEVAGDHDVQRVPTQNDVEDWVNQAKQLDRAIFY